MAEEPSKNELKKLAKKAEKAAKKQAVAGAAATTPGQTGKTTSGQNNNTGNTTTSSATTTTTTTAPTPIPTASPSPPKVLLFQGAQDDSATLKVVWAAIHYKIKVGVAKRKDLPAGCTPSKKSNKPILIYGHGDYVLGGGGNAMCKAVALMGGEALSFEADEWCEVERNTLRVHDGGAKNLKLDALATALDASATGVHLVGESDTIADICIIVTLSKYATKENILSWPSKSHYVIIYIYIYMNENECLFGRFCQLNHLGLTDIFYYLTPLS